MKKIALPGIKPTGELHIGNYLGMIKPAFELAQTYQAMYFIADYHALTTVKNPLIDRNVLCEKIRSIYPDIGQCGIDIQVEYNERQKRWVVDLKKTVTN